MDEFLDMAEELDGMDKSLNSWEATFLEDMLTKLRNGETLTPGKNGQEAKLREVYDKYLGESWGSADGDDGQVFM